MGNELELFQTEDQSLDAVADTLRGLDPPGQRWASLIRHTFDMTYKGPRPVDIADENIHLSNLSAAGPTPDLYRKLALPGNCDAGLSKPASRRPQELSKRLGRAKVAKLVERATAGESVNKLAKEQSVAVSALARMLKAQGVEIRKQGLTDAQRDLLVEG